MRSFRVAAALCLVLFPLLFAIFGGTGLHPDPTGETAADQVRAVAESEAAWRSVHLVLGAASLVGMGAVLALWGLIPRGGPRQVVATVFAAVGVAAAGLLAGIILMETALVAPVAAACAHTPVCASPPNEPFLTEFADASWNEITPLGRAAATLILALVVLAIIGAVTRVVLAWEAAVMGVGMIGIYATSTSLHSGAQYGLALLLVAGASIAVRIVMSQLSNAPRKEGVDHVKHSR